MASFACDASHLGQTFCGRHEWHRSWSKWKAPAYNRVEGTLMPSYYTSGNSLCTNGAYGAREGPTMLA